VTKANPRESVSERLGGNNFILVSKGAVGQGKVKITINEVTYIKYKTSEVNILLLIYWYSHTGSPMENRIDIKKTYDEGWVPSHRSPWVSAAAVHGRVPVIYPRKKTHHSYLTSTM
jgi:hypothetical protein